MATGTIIKSPKATTYSTGLTATSKIDSNVSNYYICRYGQMVTATGYLSFTSSASGTYTSHKIYTGMPIPLAPYGVECGFVVFDGNATDVAVMAILPDGGIEVHSRGVTAASKKGIFFMTYMSADEYSGS